jgi:8-oxo-dGTP diphosphatase
MMATRVIEVTAGVLVDHGRVLVGQRPAGTRHAGKWEFPGGKVEPGESLPECLRRELHEELAIEADVGARLWRAVHHYAGGPDVAVTFFRVVAYRGALSTQHFAALRWVTLADLVTLDVLDADRAFVVALGRGAVRLGPG